MNLSTRQLRAFCELTTERNFTRAAQKCHLSQSAFSALIANLEEQAGTRLFYRSTRNVELTAEGRVFSLVANRLLNDFEQAFTELQDHVQRRKGRLTIAALPSVAGGALPPVIASFREQYPGIDVILRDVTSDSCLDLVRNRQADFALTAARTPGPDLTSEPLITDRFHLICRDDHPLASRRTLALRDIVALPLIKFDHHSSVRQHLDVALYPHSPPTVMEVYNPVTAAGLIASGIGVTLVPTLAVFQFQLPRLVAIPVSLPIKDREVCLIRRADSPESVASSAFIEELRKMWKSKKLSPPPGNPGANNALVRKR
jgi:DNA-binding transcriptional LysR family regulator